MISKALTSKFPGERERSMNFKRTHHYHHLLCVKRGGNKYADFEFSREKRKSFRYFESANMKRHDWLNEKRKRHFFANIEEFLRSDISGQ